MAAPGFPIRPSRAAFGPRFKNAEAPKDDSTDLDGEVFDFMAALVAGMAGATPLAWVLVTSGGAIGAGGAWEVWDPDSAYSPTVARDGTGIYRVTYPAQVLDRDGIERDLSLVAARATPQLLASRFAGAVIAAGGIQANVETFLANGTTPADMPFFLQVW